MVKFYVIDPVEPCEAFEKSPWAGQGYDRKREANEVKAFLEKKFGVKFKIEVEQDDLF